MLTSEVIDRAVAAALAEDAPWGDLTSAVFIPEGTQTTARLVAREPGVFAGGAVLASAFTQCGAGLDVRVLCAEGQTFEPDAVLATVAGDARAILRGERIALNFVQRLSGIATQTARFVAAVEGTGARIADTRKTTPGLRAFERHAVRCGGGSNHRYSLSDAVLAKDNHLAVLLATGLTLEEAIRTARQRLGHTTHLEVEVDTLAQIEPVLAGGADTIMLDNFSLADLRRGVELIAGRAQVEASGGVSLDSVRAIAETGVDLISVGALTHAVRSLDLGLDVGEMVQPHRRSAEDLARA
ncbi:carboxylating nicotinate-nucleotide diphosphorylase [Micrococcales bacterium 31B]|nr:carboxylating nicotinate-nucleotide diphosphorylase [Micrococcales bacterium 31B]